MSLAGYVPLYRKLKDWEWYTDANTLRVFIHLLLSANHQKTIWRGTDVDEGEIITGRLKLAKELNIGEQSVRTSLLKLKSTNEITIKNYTKFSLIKLNNWSKYKLSTSKSTADQPTTNQQINQQLTTSENNKNIKNGKKREESRFAPPSLQEVSDYCLERGNGVGPQRFLDFYVSKGWFVGRNKMKDWRAAVRTWEQREQKTESNNLDLTNVK